MGVALAQYSMRTGIKKFQSKGEAGMTKELTQIYDMNVFHPIKRDSLTKELRAMVLALLKQDKTVKVHMCADRRKQRGDWTKQESTLLMVITELVFIMATVDAHKG